MHELAALILVGEGLREDLTVMLLSALGKPPAGRTIELRLVRTGNNGGNNGGRPDPPGFLRLRMVVQRGPEV
jgi:hypothetical protein